MSDLIETWGESLQIQWRPEVGYFDQRLRLLEELEDRDLMRAFVIEADSLRIRLDDEWELILEPTSLQLIASGPGAAANGPFDIADLALDKIAPRRVRRFMIGIQQIRPFDLDYTVVRQALMSHFFPDLLARTPLTDFAVLLDGSARSFSGTFNLEFGVVSDEELPSRLARFVGRVDEHGPSSDPDYWVKFPRPEVAFFADSLWVQPTQADTPAKDWRHFRASALEEASTLASEICHSVPSNADEKKTAR